MSEPATALLGFGVMLVLIALRAPIGLAMLVVGGAGYAWLSGWHTFFAYMKTNTYHQFANYTLSVVPLFILMGALAERTGIASGLFVAAERAFGRYRGGSAMAVIGACAAFGAICGSSVATTATFGRAALPELLRLRYDSGFAAGTIAVGGTLGILIPPSVILVIYAIVTEQNIAKLFQAALLPGILAAALYCATIAIVVRWRPGSAPAVVAAEPGKVETPTPRGVIPVAIIGTVVVGGIYGGIFTPTEGASVGVVAMLLSGFVLRQLDLAGIFHCVRQTAETAGMIFVILLGAEVFGSFLALSRLPVLAAEMVAAVGLTPMAVIVSILLVYLVLGAVMDELAMILLTLPVFFPIVQGLDLGLVGDEAAIWFGILVLIVVGIGLTAPPIGLNVFVVSSLARDVKIAAIYWGVLPFVVADLVRLGLVLLFPGLCLTLVRVLE